MKGKSGNIYSHYYLPQKHLVRNVQWKHVFGVGGIEAARRDRLGPVRCRI